MNYDSNTTVGGRAGRSRGRIRRGRTGGAGAIERAASVAVRVSLYLLVAAVAVWVALVGTTALGGMLVATMVGFGVVYALPWLVLSGGLRVLDTLE